MAIAPVDMGGFARCTRTHAIMHVDRLHLSSLFFGVRALQ